MGHLPSTKLNKPYQNTQQTSENTQIPVSYFRSRLYTAPYSSNPLLAAASPLFSLLDRLALSYTLPPIAQLREDFRYELQAYQSRIQEKNQENANHSIAYYLLTATIDELIARNYYRIFHQPVSFHAFSPIGRGEEPPSSQFFRVVDKIQHQPSQYLDIIEIAYFCLLAGFEGKFHDQVDSRQQIDNLCESLYQLIRQHRGHQKSLGKHSHQTNDKPMMSNRPLPIAVGLSAAVLASTFYFCHTHLNHKVENLAFSPIVKAQWVPHDAS
ncbi:type IVB secretion system protein IcmH/DotU [Legionella sp. W05-934-2]|jgi:type IV/VI secretion system ImpK/VasF family protein|uniref:type IVB secretion system protein IcmH/DotU n=1 Tax=Legionella sp. W05-934-2 TaxID=1198649 RepID=UPI003461A2DE